MTHPVSPVKLIAGMLYGREEVPDQVCPYLEEIFSPIDYRCAPIPFGGTDYYAGEMGEGLKRIILSFEELIDPSSLVEAKVKSREVEEKFLVKGRRRVNIDMGYLDLHKVVLASFKGRGNKVYLGEGVWADMVLFFRKGKVEILPWGFPDFKSGVYDRHLMEIRKVYKTQLGGMG